MAEVTIGGELATTEDVREHMRGTLELIAGTDCEQVFDGTTHLVYGDVHLAKVAHKTSSEDPEPEMRLLPVHNSEGLPLEPVAFEPDTCPVCMATKCLEQIDEAENREGGLL